MGQSIIARRGGGGPGKFERVKNGSITGTSTSNYVDMGINAQGSPCLITLYSTVNSKYRGTWYCDGETIVQEACSYYLEIPQLRISSAGRLEIKANGDSSYRIRY